MLVDAKKIIHKLTQSLPRILMGGVAGALVVGVVSLLVPNQYRSEAAILPADARTTNASLGQIAAAAAAVGVSIPGQDTPDVAFVDILGSRNIREKLLATKYRYRITRWPFTPEVVEEKTLYAYLGKKNQDRALAELAKHIGISRSPRTKLLTISVETNSAELSQLIVGDLVRQLELFLMEKMRTKGGSKALFAAERLVEARKNLEQEELNFRSFMRANKSYQSSSDPEVRLGGAKLELEMKLRQQLVATLSIAYEQALMEEKNDMPILNVLDKGNLPSEQSFPHRSMWMAVGCLIGFLLMSASTVKDDLMVFSAPSEN